MNNLCKGLSFYKSIISDINELLKLIRSFTTTYNVIKNTYSLNSNSGMFDILSKEYIANFEMVNKLEKLLASENASSMVSFCEENIIETFTNSESTESETYCTHYNKMVLLKNYNDKIVQKSTNIRNKFILNNYESDTMITNYNLIINEGNIFSNELAPKIIQIASDCGKDKPRKYFIIFLTIIIIIFIIVTIVIVILSINKTKKINYIINQI